MRAACRHRRRHHQARADRRRRDARRRAFAVGGRLLAADERGAWTRVDDAAQLRRRGARHRDRPRDARRGRERAQRSRAGSPSSPPITFSTPPPDPLGRSLLLTEPTGARVAPAAITVLRRRVGIRVRLRALRLRRHRAVCSPTALRDELARARDAPGDRSRPAHPRDRDRRLPVHRAGERQDDLSVPDPACCRCTTCPWYASGSILAARSIRRALAAAIRRELARLDLEPGGRSPSPSPGTAIPTTRASPRAARAHHRRSRACGRAHRAAAADDRRRRRQDLRPPPARTNSGSPATSSRSTASRCSDLDFVDVGELITPPGVVPVVIKSLLFS